MATNVDPVSTASADSRTFAARTTATARRGIRTRVISGRSRVPDWLVRTVRLLTRPRVLIAVGLLVLAAVSATIYIYKTLSAEIDARLRTGSLDNSTQIYGAPLRVAVGDRLPLNDLVGYLRGAGYEQKASVDYRTDDKSFAMGAKSIEIVPDDERASSLGLAPVKLDVDAAGRVQSLRDLRSGKAMESAAIEGELLASLREGDRRKKIPIQFSAIPETLRNAVLAVEDQRFFEHNGIDWRGTMRALWIDIREGEIVEGGSTLTQQLVKNAFLTRERTISRKLKEAAMAVILESRLTKQQIFTLYCNDVYLGQSRTFAVHGFAEAAQVYFDKNLSDLTLAESAFLAGLIRAPNRYSPQRDPSSALARRSHVLDRMVAIGAITPPEAAAARVAPLQIKTHAAPNDFGMNYFIDYAQSYMSEHGVDTERSQPVYGTIDPRLQRIACDVVTRRTQQLDKLFSRSTRRGKARPPVQAALVALDAHSGQVLAMIGGRSYDESQLNRATDALRQPGSAFKPLVYAAALSTRGFTAATVLSDRPQTFIYDGGSSEYQPSDYHGGFTNRDVTLREALARSLNVPAVELAERVGLGNVARLAEDCGLHAPRPYPSMALGTSEVTPLELAAAYTAFANGGMALHPVPVARLGATSSTNTGRGTRVFSPQVAYLMTNLLESVVQGGTASRARGMGVTGAIAGKTGTSTDGWFVGYTPNLVCAVWVGFDDNRDLGLTASESALPMWADFVKQAIDIRPSLGGRVFARPGGIVTADIDPSTGLIATDECAQHRKELFISGTEPVASCSHQNSFTADASILDAESEYANGDSPAFGTITLVICVDTGLRASPDCPRVDSKQFQIGKEPIETCSAEHHR